MPKRKNWKHSVTAITAVFCTIPTMIDRIKTFFIALICAFCLLPTAPTVAGKAPILHSEASAWIVLDGLSGSVLNESHSKDVVNPGDLVHLMTLYTALEMIGNDPQKMHAPVAISPEDSLLAKSPRRLYLVSGEPAPLQQLLNGIAVVAAEDASLAVSAYLAGSKAAFVQKMNETAQTIGMTQSHFTSPIAGDDQKTSAYDLAKLAVAMHQRHPEEFKWFSQREFIFTNHTQRNRNLMLWKADDIGGIMTNEASTDIISSWHRNAGETTLPRHIFAVLLGGKNADTATNDMLSLLRNGRLDYETVRLFTALTPIKRIDILTGNRDKLEVGAQKDIWVTVKRKDIAARGTGGFSSRFQYLSPAVAPVKTGDEIGTLSVFFENNHIADFPLIALHDVGMGSFLSRFVDSVRLRMKPAKSTTESMAEPSTEGMPVTNN